ncbi:MAG: hypothetical protein NTX22_06685 [Ignavibacteriales bacterium]|nr:hypothetical protein [Ignavibacteriales bacterium]
MENLSKLAKFFLFVCVLSVVLWFGGYFLRLLLTYQLYEPRDLILKSYVNQNNLSGILFTLNTAVTFTLILFPIFLISFVLFLLTSKVNLKREGWLLIILLVVIITAPFEIFLMTIDYKIATKVLYGNFMVEEILNLYSKRLAILSSFPLIEIFSYAGIVFLALFKPLKMKNK